MDRIRVLLCCGGGYSSGLLAQRTRKAARQRNIAADVDARSESQAQSFLGQIDVLLLGPHYANQLERFQQMADPYDVPVEVIPHQIYGLIDGDGLLDLAIHTVLKHKGETEEGESNI